MKIRSEFGVLIAVICLAGCAVAKQSNETTQATVMRPQLVTTVKAPGQALMRQEADIYPQRTGVIESFNVNLGDTVKKGQLIATLRPDQSESQLLAEIAFKKRELEIARRVADSAQMFAAKTAQANLQAAKQQYETLQQKQVLQVDRVRAERDALMVDVEQSASSAENAVHALLDSMANMLYTKSDALRRFSHYSTENHYRRREIYYPHDDQARAFETALHQFYRSFTSDQFANKQVELFTEAIELGRQANILSGNFQSSPTLTREQITLIIGSLTEANNRLIETSNEYLTKKMELAGLLKELEVLRNQDTTPFVAPVDEPLQLERHPDTIAAELTRLQQQVGAARTVHAPFTGVVIKKNVHVGNSVNLNTELLRLVDNSSKYISFPVSESIFHLVREGDRVEFATSTEPDKLYSATVRRIAQSIDPETGTIAVEADIDAEADQGRILARMDVTVHIPLPEGKEYYEIPLASLELSSVPDVIWLANGSKGKQSPVKVVYKNGGNAYVEGVSENDSVIVSMGSKENPLIRHKSQQGR